MSTPGLLPPLLLLLVALGGARAEVKYGYKDWTLYEVGNASVILSAGHGGELEPNELLERHNGCPNGTGCAYVYNCSPKSKRCRIVTVTDSYTRAITEAVARAMRAAGVFPHVVLNTVRRTLVDMNRPEDQACFGLHECVQLYRSYHAFIEEARAAMRGSVGLYIDVHGQKHPQNWTELGYRVTKAEINSGAYEDRRSSVHHLRLRTGLALGDLLAGNASLGHMLARRGYRVVPSPQTPAPGDGGYYRGGFCTGRYGSEADGHCTDAIQVELPKTLRYGGPAVRDMLAQDLAAAILEFVSHHGYGSRDWACGGGGGGPSGLLVLAGLLGLLWRRG